MGEQSAAEQKVGLESGSMKSNQQAFVRDAMKFFVREFIPAQSFLVLEDVIDVFALHSFQQEAKVPTDLKIDEIGSAVVAEKDIFRLVGIDVGDAAAMDFGEQFHALVEESIGHWLVGREGAAVNVFVYEPRIADLADQLGNIRKVGQIAIKSRSAAAEKSPDPCQRQSEHRRHAADFQHDPAPRVIFVKPGGRHEVVLDGLDETIRDAVDFESWGKRVFSQGAHPMPDALGGVAMVDVIGIV